MRMTVEYLMNYLSTFDKDMPVYVGSVWDDEVYSVSHDVYDREIIGGPDGVVILGSSHVGSIYRDDEEDEVYES